MISIVICSRNKQTLLFIEENVAATIGVSYEIIAVDNSAGKYGICAAYNKGAAQAKYDLLCFMHEDIKFHTSDWGTILADILRRPETGVVGVAGGTHQPKAPAGWYGSGPYPSIGINVIHTTSDGTEHNYNNPFKTNLAAASTLDGLWLCCRKSVWEEFKFDSVAFPGFHFYDVDFCTRVFTKFTNYITFDVLIEHFSHGTFDKVWMQNALNFYKQRKNYLPFGVQYLTKTELDYHNVIAMHRFAQLIIQHGLPKKDILYCLKECLKLNPLNRDTIYLLRKQLFAK